MRYLGLFETLQALQAALDNDTLLKPYVALYGDNYARVNFNKLSKTGSTPVEPAVDPVHDYSQDYLTLEILSDGSLSIDEQMFNNFCYSKDNGANWTSVGGDDEITFATGDIVLLKANNMFLQGSSRSSCFSWADTAFNVYGNIMSLCYGDNFANQTTFKENTSFTGLFSNSGVISAEHLILPALDLSDTSTEYPIYAEMFDSCSNLISAPALPATTLNEGCYDHMFYNCTSLTTAPELPALTLPEQAYLQMFDGCSSLNYIKCLATDISAFECVNLFMMNVGDGGTFVKNPNMADWIVGSPSDSNSHIPNTWTVIDAA